MRLPIKVISVCIGFFAASILTGCIQPKAGANTNPLQSQPPLVVAKDLTRVLPIVNGYRARAQEAGAPEAFLDYYIVLQSAIKVLSEAVKNPNLPDQIRVNARNELEILDPNNNYFLALNSQERILSSRQRAVLQFSSVAETSAFNLAVYDSVSQLFPVAGGKVESGIWQAPYFEELFSKQLSSIPGCNQTTLYLECLIMHFQDKRIPVFIHPSARSILSAGDEGARESTNKNISLATALRLSATQGVSVLFFPNGFYIFNSTNIPEGWQETQTRTVYRIQAQHLNVEALASAIGAAGFSSAVRSIDRVSGSVLLTVTPRQYVYIWLAVNSLDVAQPRIKIDVEFIEIQDSFLRDVGVRIPQTIGAAFGDPVYRYYNFGTNVQLPNGGLVSQIGNTGGVTLSNYLSGNVQNVVRLLVADESFRISAKEANISLNVSERPSILIDSGATGHLRVGQRVPVLSRRVTPKGEVFESTTSIETGVDLTVTGRVVDRKRVAIGVDMSVSNFSDQTSDSRSTAIPAVNSRRLTSDFTVEHLETVVLGGIVSERMSSNSDGLPGFRLVPFLETLGGARKETANKTRIIILLTPRIEISDQVSDFSYLTVFGGEENISFAPTVNGIINSYNNQVISQGGNAGGRLTR